jgi:hypothetical protein
MRKQKGKYYQDNLCKECRKRSNREYRKVNKKMFRLAEVRKRRNIKAKVMKAYGGKCECCGEDRFEFLTIDHIKGNGSKHRKEINGMGERLYWWLQREKFPNGFRVLCFNCNCSRGAFGYCPHKEKSKWQKLMEE